MSMTKDPADPRAVTVACIGGAHLDYRGITAGPARLGSSNLGVLARDFGGVARNVAATLARLGVEVRLISRVGADAEGDRVRAALVGRGIDDALMGRSNTRSTASYTAILDDRGELVIGLADMAIYDELGPGELAPALAAVADAALWMIDTNPPAAALEFICGAEGPPVVANAISVARAPRLRGVIPRLFALFANRGEAAAITGVESDDPMVLASALRALGCKAGVVTAGAAPGVVWSGDVTRPLTPLTARPRDVTGAGDALMAGTIAGLVEGLSLFEAARLGLAAAALTVESPESTAPHLSRPALAARLLAGDEA